MKGIVPAEQRQRLYATDMLGNPDEEHEYILHKLTPLADSLR